MTRFTDARLRRWQAELAKIEALTQRLADDMGAVRTRAKGGRLQHVTEAIVHARSTLAAIAAVDVALDRLAVHEAAKRPKGGA